MSVLTEPPRTTAPPVRRWHRSSPARVLVIAVGATAGLAATYLLAVRTAAGQATDTGLMRWLAAVLDHPHWAGALLGLVSPPTVLAAAAAVTLLAGAARGGAAAVAALSTVLVTVGASQALKATLERPDLRDLMANSLPSGHVAAVAAVAVAAYVAAPSLLRPALALAGATATVLVGIATVALEWHRPSDVVAAVLLAVAIGAAAESVRLLPGRRAVPRG